MSKQTRTECVEAHKVDPVAIHKMLSDSWKITDVYHLNGSVTIIYERRSV